MSRFKDTGNILCFFDKCSKQFETNIKYFNNNSFINVWGGLECVLVATLVQSLLLFQTVKTCSKKRARKVTLGGDFPVLG